MVGVLEVVEVRHQEKPEKEREEDDDQASNPTFQVLQLVAVDSQAGPTAGVASPPVNRNGLCDEPIEQAPVRQADGLSALRARFEMAVPPGSPFRRSVVQG
ncbi:MAG: hypothetical protein LAO05_12780 [Acidobacteriia bacterium]|nr:hypothetical protein [Terriglobia bacterium]